MTRVAAVDCGTNTIRLLVADLDRDTGTEREITREMRVVRLGQDVDRTGRLAPEALARTFAAIEEYVGLIRSHGAQNVRFCATSAARDAANADEFATGVRERLGVSPEVIDGASEARLSFAGATRGLAGLDDPVLVVDIGGGSTELVIGSGGEPDAARSLDIGSVRLTERLLTSDPPSRAQVEAATAYVDGQLDEAGDDGVDIAAAASVVGVAGTVTTVAAMVLDLDEYDRSRVHHARLDVGQVHAASDRLLAMTHDERRALPYMHPGRADVIGAGALILDRVMRRAHATEMVVSEADILDGIAWSLIARSR
jgi:exopolyphosphatase/guanosine-5'-triphosphate,3'-diphosphate pyrophosphatase